MSLARPPRRDEERRASFARKRRRRRRRLHWHASVCGGGKEPSDASVSNRCRRRSVEPKTFNLFRGREIRRISYDESFLLWKTPRNNNHSFAPLHPPRSLPPPDRIHSFTRTNATPRYHHPRSPKPASRLVIRGRTERRTKTRDFLFFLGRAPLVTVHFLTSIDYPRIEGKFTATTVGLTNLFYGCED